MAGRTWRLVRDSSGCGDPDVILSSNGLFTRATQSLLPSILANLPQSLPCPCALHDSKYERFIGFVPNPEQVNYTGDEPSAVSCKPIFGWQAQTTGDGTIELTEHGEALSSIVNILSKYLTKYPENGVLKKWVDDITEAAKKVFQEQGVPVCDILPLQHLTNHPWLKFHQFLRVFEHKSDHSPSIDISNDIQTSVVSLDGVTSSALPAHDDSQPFEQRPINWDN